MTEPFAELAREIDELYSGEACLPMHDAVKRALSPRIAQAARQIAGDRKVYIEGRGWCGVEEVEQILQDTVGR